LEDINAFDEEFMLGIGNIDYFLEKEREKSTLAEKTFWVFEFQHVRRHPRRSTVSKPQ